MPLPPLPTHTHPSSKHNVKYLFSPCAHHWICRDSEYIVADTNGNAYWSDVPSSSLKQSISEQVLVNYMEYLIDNIYVIIGSRIYRQCIGIPMGTNCAPLVANLFLFSFLLRE